jgi:hypothetical protein
VVAIVVVFSILERLLDAEVRPPNSNKMDSRVKLTIRVLVVRPRMSSTGL